MKDPGRARIENETAGWEGNESAQDNYREAPKKQAATETASTEVSIACRSLSKQHIEVLSECLQCFADIEENDPRRFEWESGAEILIISLNKKNLYS